MSATSRPGNAWHSGRRWIKPLALRQVRAAKVTFWSLCINRQSKEEVAFSVRIGAPALRPNTSGRCYYAPHRISSSRRRRARKGRRFRTVARVLLVRSLVFAILPAPLTCPVLVVARRIASVAGAGAAAPFQHADRRSDVCDRFVHRFGGRTRWARLCHPSLRNHSSRV